MDPTRESDLTSEEVDFGKLGTFTIQQFSGSAFHKSCSEETTNRTSVDATGLRIHPGAHVLIRFLAKHPQLIHAKHVIELGCGTGISAIGALLTNARPTSYLCTDGNVEAVQVCELNMAALAAVSSPSPANTITTTTIKSCLKVNCEAMMWDSSSVAGIIQKYPLPPPRPAPDPAAVSVSERYDVVLGSELFYYLTDLNALCETIVELAGTTGVFIGAHIFRKAGQDLELAQMLHSKYQWVLCVAPLEGFVDAEEQARFPGWFNAVQLVCGTENAVQECARSAGTDIGFDVEGVGSWRRWRGDGMAPVKLAAGDDCDHTGNSADWMGNISL